MVADDPLYARRRIDQLTDERLRDIERNQRENGAKLDRLEARLNYIAGGLAVLSVALNILAPVIYGYFQR
jgi:hypothetical protein